MGQQSTYALSYFWNGGGRNAQQYLYSRIVFGIIYKLLNKQITKDWVFFQNTQTAAVRLFLFQKFYIVYERKKMIFSLFIAKRWSLEIYDALWKKLLTWEVASEGEWLPNPLNEIHSYYLEYPALTPAYPIVLWPNFSKFLNSICNKAFWGQPSAFYMAF